jgi:hypothetical protein
MQIVVSHVMWENPIWAYDLLCYFAFNLPGLHLLFYIILFTYLVTFSLCIFNYGEDMLVAQ